MGLRLSVRRTALQLTALQLTAVLGIPAAAVLATSIPSSAKTKPSSVKPSPVYGPTEQPLGRTYADWLAEWGRFAFGGPSATNPLLNVATCSSWSQPDPARVFFLGASGPGKYTTSCSVPSGVPIVLTPGGVFSWNTDDRRDAILEEINTVGTGIRRPKLVIDGRSVDVSKYLVETDFGTITIEAPEFGPLAGAGPVTTKAKGWMLVAKPLSDGQHRIVTSAELQRLDANGKPVLVKGKPTWDVAQVTFTLTVGAVR